MPIERLSDEFLNAIRIKHSTGAEGRLVQHLGAFMLWFSVAELHLTEALALILGYHDLDRAEVLVRGMDARVKCQRLRQAAKEYWPLGSYLSREIEKFETACIKTRNNIAHSWPHLNDNSDIVYFTRLNKLAPLGDAGQSSNVARDEGIHVDDLTSQTAWLNGFAGDVMSAMRTAVRDKPFEASDERMRLQLGDH